MQVFTCKYLHTCCLLTWLTTEVQHQDSPGLPLLFQPCCWMPLVTYRNQFFFHHVMSSAPLGSCWWLQPALARSSGRETAGCLLEADTNHPSAQRGPVPGCTWVQPNDALNRKNDRCRPHRAELRALGSALQKYEQVLRYLYCQFSQ